MASNEIFDWDRIVPDSEEESTQSDDRYKIRRVSKRPSLGVLQQSSKPDNVSKAVSLPVVQKSSKPNKVSKAKSKPCKLWDSNTKDTTFSITEKEETEHVPQQDNNPGGEEEMELVPQHDNNLARGEEETGELTLNVDHSVIEKFWAKYPNLCNSVDESNFVVRQHLYLLGDEEAMELDREWRWLNMDAEKVRLQTSEVEQYQARVILGAIKAHNEK